MNPNHFTDSLTDQLRTHHKICQEFLDLFTRENQALHRPEPWHPDDYCTERKRLLPRLESVLIQIRAFREMWQRMTTTERDQYEEIKLLLRDIQNILPRLLLLDRENQQEMLKRGLVPPTQLPPAASQRPHFVTNLYRRHAAA